MAADSAYCGAAVPAASRRERMPAAPRKAQIKDNPFVPSFARAWQLLDTQNKKIGAISAYKEKRQSRRSCRLCLTRGGEKALVKSRRCVLTLADSRLLSRRRDNMGFLEKLGNKYQLGSAGFRSRGLIRLKQCAMAGRQRAFFVNTSRSGPT